MSMDGICCFIYDVCGCDHCPVVEEGEQTDKIAFSASDICRVSTMHVLVKDHGEPAYFTVEAALIMPVVMLLTVMMIFLAIYSYDRCVMEHSAYEAALQGTKSHFKTAEEAQSAACAAAERLVRGKLFAMYDFRYDVAVDAASVTVTYHCVVNMPLVTWLGEYVSGIDTALDVSKSAGRLRQTRAIRDSRILNGLITE